MFTKYINIKTGLNRSNKKRVRASAGVEFYILSRAIFIIPDTGCICMIYILCIICVHKARTHHTLMNKSPPVNKSKKEAIAVGRHCTYTRIRDRKVFCYMFHFLLCPAPRRNAKPEAKRICRSSRQRMAARNSGNRSISLSFTSSSFWNVFFFFFCKRANYLVFEKGVSFVSGLYTRAPTPYRIL